MQLAASAQVRNWHSFTVPACARRVFVGDGRPAVATGAVLAADFVRGSWLCENSERTSTEGNRVLPVPGFPSVLAIACEDMVAGEERRSTCSSRPSVLTRPRPVPDL